MVSKPEVIFKGNIETLDELNTLLKMLDLK